MTNFSRPAWAWVELPLQVCDLYELFALSTLATTHHTSSSPNGGHGQAAVASECTWSPLVASVLQLQALWQAAPLPLTVDSPNAGFPPVQIYRLPAAGTLPS